MPFFRVVLEGDGVAMEGQSGTIIGFFTTRTVFAKDTRMAVEKAKASVLDEWHEPKNLNQPKENSPNFRVELIERIGLWRFFFGGIPNAGFTFYTKR